MPPPAVAVRTERVSVLVPVRDDADRIVPCLRSVLASRKLAALEVVVYDDGSTDATAATVRELADADSRLTLLSGAETLPPGWLGKPHACARLAEHAHGEVFAFLDADVELAPDGLGRALAALDGLDLLCPYPRQLAGSAAERLVQPLLQWSWLTFLPLGLAERSRRPSLTAANGQLMLVHADAYRRAGGHAGVRDQVLDDLALARAVKRSGGRVALADGTHLARCRMYTSWPELRDGYSKSLWAAFGSPAGAGAVLGGLTLLYLAPALRLLRAPGPLPLAGYAAGVAGRALVARRVGARVWPDSAAHPLSVLAVGYLTVRSLVLRRAGRLRWKGRPL